jgi:hypothetical protein
LPSAKFLSAVVAYPQDGWTTAGPACDAAVGGIYPRIRQHLITKWATLDVRIPYSMLVVPAGRAHYARSKQYRKKPAPRTKKTRKRAKNLGPINVARRKKKLIDSFAKVYHKP